MIASHTRTSVNAYDLTGAVPMDSMVTGGKKTNQGHKVYTYMLTLLLLFTSIYTFANSIDSDQSVPEGTV